MKPVTQQPSRKPPIHLKLMAWGLRHLRGWPLRDRLVVRLDRALSAHGWVDEKEIEGIRWHLEFDDLGCRATYLDDCHEAETSFYLAHLIQPGDTLWDIGACHGFVSLRMARLAGSEGRVVAFEPVSVNRARMDKNLALNPQLAARIQVHPYALSNAPGSVIMQRTSAANPGASYIVTEQPALDKGRTQAGEAGREEVEVRTVDSVWRQAGSSVVAGVKIDVEGHELHVLAGMRELMKNSPPQWFLIEVREPYLIAAGGTKEELFAWFARHGYIGQRLVAGHTLVPDHTPRNAAAILFLRT